MVTPYTYAVYTELLCPAALECKIQMLAYIHASVFSLLCTVVFLGINGVKQ